jgi:hypothetical protein
VAGNINYQETPYDTVFTKPWGAALPPPNNLQMQKIPDDRVGLDVPFKWVISFQPSSLFNNKESFEPRITTPEQYRVVMYSLTQNERRVENAHYLQEIVYNESDDPAAIFIFDTSQRYFELTEERVGDIDTSALDSAIVVSISQIHPITGTPGLPAFRTFYFNNELS